MERMDFKPSSEERIEAKGNVEIKKLVEELDATIANSDMVGTRDKWKHLRDGLVELFSMPGEVAKKVFFQNRDALK